MRSSSRHLLVVAVTLPLCLFMFACPGGGGGGGFFSGDPAYADMFNALGSTEGFTLLGRIVEEEDPVDPVHTSPGEEFSQDEIDNAEVSLTLLDGNNRLDLGTATANEEGYLDAPIDLSGLGLDPGNYTVEVAYEGTAAGTFNVRVLGADHVEPVVRSDVDLTYINTDFMSSTGLLGLVADDATKREALPAMEVIYRRLRAGQSGAEDRPLIFLSGSPRFFKRTLEGKMQLDGVEQDGLVLKPFKDIVVENIVDFDLGQIVPELKEQIGYKLYWLLRLRLDIPSDTPELLLGDDSEADVVVYALYHRFTSGEFDGDSLGAELDRIGVAKAWSDLIAPLTGPVTAHLAGNAPVVAIYINQTGKPNDAYAVADWTIDGLVRYHDGAWPLALDLFEEGWIADAGVEEVRQRLLALGQTGEALDQRAADAVADGILDPGTATSFRGTP